MTLSRVAEDSPPPLPLIKIDIDVQSAPPATC